MSQISRFQVSKSRIAQGIFGIVALSLSFGAIQFASGRDLGPQAGPVMATSADAAAMVINRSAKADRGARIAQATAPMQTIALRLNGLSDTSVLVRVPYAREASTSSPSQSLIKA